jgi:hypothetical protein
LCCLRVFAAKAGAVVGNAIKYAPNCNASGVFGVIGYQALDAAAGKWRFMFEVI